MNAAAADSVDRALHIVVRVGSEQFAFPVSAVEEALDAPVVEWVPVAPDGMLGQLRHRGRMVGAWDARWAFGLRHGSGGAAGPAAGRTAGAALVLRAGERRFALVVDDVVEMSLLAPGSMHAVPGGADLDGTLSGVCFSAQDGNSLVNVVRVETLVARASAPVSFQSGSAS